MIRAWKKHWRVAGPAVAFVVLAAATFAFGVNPWIAVRHFAWYALGDVDAVPVWVQTTSPFTSNVPPTGGRGTAFGPVERVESWGVPSSAAREMLQRQEFLTDWWRDEITRAIEGNASMDDNPLMQSYPPALAIATSEFANAVGDDTLMEKLMDEEKAPGPLQASGCPPSSRFSRTNMRVFYNAAPRRSCDNVVGGLLWIFVAAVAFATVSFTRARSKAA